MENIIKGIRQYYPVSDSSLEVLFSHMEKLELPKKHLLIRGGVQTVTSTLSKKDFAGLIVYTTAKKSRSGFHAKVISLLP